MNLFLLLSAFLTALTGAITGVRPAQASVQEQVLVATAQAETARIATAGARPVQGWPMLALQPATGDRPWSLAPAIPGFGQRRRE